jgi:putative oxidoreductase
MNIALWIAQVLLALGFLMAGFLKSTQPLNLLAKRMAWVSALPPAVVRFIGVVEILGGLGVILPIVTGILPWLTPLAAIGLVVVMAGAAILHVSRGEYSNIGVNAVLLALAAFVAYGRWI